MTITNPSHSIKVPSSGDIRHESPAIGVCGVDEKGKVKSKDGKDVR